MIELETFVIQRIGFVLTMEWIADPSIWAGLITLIVIELVLGIDNLVFIAILAEKLPPKQRDRARVTGLLLAMLMRLLLLASISWLVTLTQPLFSFRLFTFSARDLIMLFGGFFPLFKATMELNERLEGKTAITHATQRCEVLGVVTQIVVLDAIFLTRLGDYRRRDGRPFTGHDGRRGYRYQPDVDGQQAVNAIC